MRDYDACPTEDPPMRRLACLAALVAVLLVPGRMALAQDAAAITPDKAQVCDSCHGENGVPVDAAIPNIWGQHQGYLYLQLRDFKRGNRLNEIMKPFVETMEREEMMAYAEYYAKKAWPRLQVPSPSPETVKRAEIVAASAGPCTACHQDGYKGDGTQPRTAGQSYEYMKKTMLDFRKKVRLNNSWMTDLLATMPEQDIDALAQYMAAMTLR
jgi:cytochrome c553